MRNSVAGTHTTSTSQILLNSELAQDKFYDFSIEILANMKRGDEYHLHIRNEMIPYCCYLGQSKCKSKRQSIQRHLVHPKMYCQIND